MTGRGIEGMVKDGIRGTYVTEETMLEDAMSCV